MFAALESRPRFRDRAAADEVGGKCLSSTLSHAAQVRARVKLTAREFDRKSDGLVIVSEV